MGVVAQLVVRWFCIPEVMSSILINSTSQDTYDETIIDSTETSVGHEIDTIEWSNGEERRRSTSRTSSFLYRHGGDSCSSTSLSSCSFLHPVSWIGRKTCRGEEVVRRGGECFRGGMVDASVSNADVILMCWFKSSRKYLSYYGSTTYSSFSCR